MKPPASAAGERHSFLIIIRFNMDDGQNPLSGGAIDAKNEFEKLAPFRASLVVGIVDPSTRSATTPLINIKLEGDALTQYNDILRGVERLNDLYRGEKGYLSNPSRMNKTQKDGVVDKIRGIGKDIYELLIGEEQNVVRDWIDRLFREQRGDRPGVDEPEHHVTIVTNDFSIPWYWLARRNLCLCEIVSLGMLQLTSYSSQRTEPDPSWREVSNDYRALLISGSPDSPFAADELHSLASGLAQVTDDEDVSVVRVLSDQPSTRKDLSAFREDNLRAQRLDQYRIVHFAGLYSYDRSSRQSSFIWNGKPVELVALEEFIGRSIVVLDASSNSEGLNAWTDTEGVTNSLIGFGAFACVVAVLPLKTDPIIAEIFWGAFYSALRVVGTSVGSALRRARLVLRNRLEEMGISNPAWLLYQLIGNPSVEAFAEPRDRIEPRP